MKKTNLYIVHNAVFSINKLPLDENRNIRPSLNKIFNNNFCFREFRLNILRFRKEQAPPLPFIKNLGSIIFSPNSLRLSNSLWFHRDTVPQLLAGREEYKNPEEPLQEDSFSLDDDYKIFGYNSKLEDQRHNFLYFETSKSLYIKYVLNGECLGTGRVYTHIYPFGYIVISFALNVDSFKVTGSINTILKETRLSNKNSNWLWQSKFGNLPLSEIFFHIKKSIFESLFEPDNIPSAKVSIHSSIKYFDNIEFEMIGVLKGEKSKFEIGGKFLVYDEELNVEYEWPGRPVIESFEINQQGLLFKFSHERTRKTALRLFWKINTIYEYAFIQKRIFHDYKNYLTDKIQELKEFRFQFGKKMLEEDISKFSVYEPSIPRFIYNFNKHISRAAPFYRKIYHTIETGIKLKNDREELKVLIKEWEQEVEKWDPPVKALWKKILSPLRSLLGL